ncbi:7818_t:CDS:2 [Acaulospora colombiana]|uniref:7818_t:CDS:1 n=1 Tax=Acaulospora colombiana TaxID=27376 RepID=A0ACA9LR86_9GLOM|nr:7818_t:CDS:2 [Acaulospora colombiana]
MKTTFFSESSEWSLFKFLKFRQNEDTWTADKQKEHSTYITTLRRIAESGSSKQPIVVSALDTFEVKGEANTKEVTEFWEDMEKEQNAKKLKNILKDLDDDFEPIEQITKKEKHGTRSGRKIPEYCEMTSSSSEGDNNASSDHEQPSIEEEKTSAIRSTKRMKSNDQEQSVNEDELQISSGYSTPSPQLRPPEQLIHQKIMPVQDTTLNPEYELKFREAIKKATKNHVNVPLIGSIQNLQVIEI